MAKGICGTRGTGNVVANLFAWVKGATAMSEMAMEKFGKNCEDYCKTQHPWRNRTGEAERELGHMTDREGKSIIEFIYHGAEHGIYLETREDFMGKYKVLDESIQVNKPGLMADLRGIFGGVTTFPMTFQTTEQLKTGNF